MTTRYASGVWPRVARRNGIHEATYYWRVRNGWDPGRAATEPPNDRPEGMLTTPEVADLLGVSFRQLDYWSRTNLIRASVTANGSGSRRFWSAEDVEALTGVADLLSIGMRLGAVRKMLTQDPSGFAERSRRVVDAISAAAEVES